MMWRAISARPYVMVPATQRCDDFPSYQPCVDKRRSYMLDMDAYENKREAAKAGCPGAYTRPLFGST